MVAPPKELLREASGEGLGPLVARRGLGWWEVGALDVWASRESLVEVAKSQRCRHLASTVAVVVAVTCLVEEGGGSPFHLGMRHCWRASLVEVEERQSCPC